MAELHRILLFLHREELEVWEPAPWASVIYALRMAASIEDIEADTGFVVDTMTFALCEATGDFEDAQSEMASKYVAAATIFNFVWQAYEMAVAETAPGELSKLAKGHRHGERGRRLLEARPELDGRFRGIRELVELAMTQCRQGGLMNERCDGVEESHGGSGLVTAAELAREFRNFVVHGGDEAPVHADWDHGDRVSSACRVHRFYSVSRLVLYLIQAMSWITHAADARTFRCGPDDVEVRVTDMVERLQFRGPGPWPPLDRS